MGKFECGRLPTGQLTPPVPFLVWARRDYRCETARLKPGLDTLLATNRAVSVPGRLGLLPPRTGLGHADRCAATHSSDRRAVSHVILRLSAGRDAQMWLDRPRIQAAHGCIASSHSGMGRVSKA